MPLTKEFKETIMVDLQDREFRGAYLADAIAAMHGGEFSVGKRMLCNYINATVGFDALSKAVGSSAKSLMRMFGETSTPRAEPLFGILKYLQRTDRFEVRVVPRLGKAYEKLPETRPGVRRKLARRARPDSEINTLDIPPLTEEFFRRAVRNPFFRLAARQKLKLTHPGRILRDEFMKPVGLSGRALAKALYVPMAKVKPLLESRIAISAEMAVLLTVYFGTSDRYWIDLQAHHDLQVAKDRVRAHAARIVPHTHDRTGALRRIGS